MSYYSNPTANAAMGSVDKRIRKIEKEVKRLRSLHQKGELTVEEFLRVRSRYRGFYRRVFENALKARPTQGREPPAAS